MHSDPEVMFFIGKGVRSREETATHLENILTHQQQYGYSAWAVHEKKSGEFVGRAGLIHLGALIGTDTQNTPETPVELGYVLHKKFWGQGFAKETARAILEFGFTQTSLSRIIAKTNAQNLASQNILESIGMQFEEHTIIEEKKGMIFAITKERFLANATS